MGVYIKGMEMPDRCGRCRFATAFDCGVDKQFIPTHDERRYDCPLVPVPPHGRLIDADALVDEAYQPGAYGYVDALQIENAPTIIEAEGDNE